METKNQHIEPLRQAVERAEEDLLENGMEPMGMEAVRRMLKRENGFLAYADTGYERLATAWQNLHEVEKQELRRQLRRK